MSAIPALPLTVVLVGVVIAATTDAWKFRVYDVLTVPLLATGVVYHGLIAGAAGVVECLLGILIATGPLLWPYSQGGMGAGDLKLMLGIGAWLGPWVALHVLIASGLETGVYAIGLLLWRSLTSGSRTYNQGVWAHGWPTGTAAEPRGTLTARLQAPDRRRNVIPFAVLVALGVVLTAFWLGRPIEANRTIPAENESRTIQELPSHRDTDVASGIPAAT